MEREMLAPVKRWLLIASVSLYGKSFKLRGENKRNQLALSMHHTHDKMRSNRQIRELSEGNQTNGASFGGVIRQEADARRGRIGAHRSVAERIERLLQEIEKRQKRRTSAP